MAATPSNQIQTARTYSMLRMTRSLAVLIFAGAIAPVGADAASLGRILHLHPGSPHPVEGRITVVLFNNRAMFREVKIDGRNYAVMPHHAISVTALPGTQVLSAGPGAARPGEVLVTLDRSVKDATIYLN
jgi:hypothetical protein